MNLLYYLLLNFNIINVNELDFEYIYDFSNLLISDEEAFPGNSYSLHNPYDKDGNITELKRYNGSGSMMDNFNYSYYSETNKLQRVFGSTPQYTYDANGNMITDEVNRNRDIEYDHRNLIKQITHKEIIFEDSLLYASYYYYDEAGNRIRKKVYKYIGIQTRDSVETPDIESIGDSPSAWLLINDEVYSHDVSGKEVAL